MRRPCNFLSVESHGPDLVVVHRISLRVVGEGAGSSAGVLGIYGCFGNLDYVLWQASRRVGGSRYSAFWGSFERAPCDLGACEILSASQGGRDRPRLLKPPKENGHATQYCEPGPKTS